MKQLLRPALNQAPRCLPAVRQSTHLPPPLQAAYPTSQIVFLANYPQTWFPTRSAVLLREFRPVLRRRGVQLLLCGQGLNPASKVLYEDGLHLAAPGYEVVFECLEPQLRFPVAVQRTLFAALNQERRAALPPLRRAALPV